MAHLHCGTSDDLGSLLSAYIDNELDEQETQRVAFHLQTCHKCASLIEDFRELSLHVNHTFRQLTAPDWLEQSILVEIEEIRQSEQVSHLRAATSFGALTLSILFLGILLSPAGKVIWSLLTITTRIGHGFAVLLLHLILGNVWMIGAIVLCILVSVVSIVMMKKMIQNTIVSLH